MMRFLYTEAVSKSRFWQGCCWNLIFALFLFICVFGCQKKDKHLVRLRAIYDQPVFSEIYMQAAQDEEKFSHFKSNPLFKLLFENRCYEEGISALSEIEARLPAFAEKKDLFRENDRFGSPEVWEYGKWGAFSPTTLHYVAFAAKIKCNLGDVSNKHLLQIGAGYGGLCKIMHDAFSFSSYTIVDFAPQLQLAQAYLKHFGINNVQLYTFDQLPSEISYDCVFSDGNFSELCKEDQSRLINRVFKQIDTGFFSGAMIPQHFGVSTLSVDGIVKALAKQKKSVSLTSLERGAYEFYWKTQF
ncbi:MAG: putative sugar O-methyltransferase [Rhabdochlamydiaceae bacterium]|nr:putative sugar O-methyltransferase [Rhabdochlamydiaceae bacterium]